MKIKIPSGRRTRMIAALLAVALVAGSGVWWFLQRDALPEDAAFRVDGTTVQVGEVEQRAATLKALYGIEVPTDPAQRRQFWRDTAQAMALSQVVDKAAKERGITIPRRNAEQALADYITRYFGEGAEGRDAFVAALGSQATSEAQVRAEVSRHLLLTRLFAEVTSDVPAPDEAAVRRAFDERRCLLTTPERRRIRNIVVTGKADARRVMNTLRRGTSFAELARSHSADRSTADRGGDLGLVAREDLEEGYAEAAFSADRGEVFGPIRSEHGWNVGVVVEVRKPQDPPYRKVAEQLGSLLHYEAQASVWRAWLQGRLDKAEVVYAESYRPKDPGALPTSMSDPTGTAEACQDGQ